MQQLNEKESEMVSGGITWPELIRLYGALSKLAHRNDLAPTPRPAMPYTKPTGAPSRLIR